MYIFYNHVSLFCGLLLLLLCWFIFSLFQEIGMDYGGSQRTKLTTHVFVGRVYSFQKLGL